jgi:hypothetical protein
MRRILVALLLAGCSSGPKYKIDDNTLAQVPLAEKQGIMASQNEQIQAKEELRKAKADLDQVDREEDIADNELKSAKLSLDTAEMNKKAAEQSGDMNRKSSADRDIHVAELGVKAAKAKAEWLSKKHKWMKQIYEAAQDHQSSADAKYELEKAKVASSKGIKPSSDFNVMNFETESLEKSKRYSETRLDADKRKADVDDLERKFNNVNQEYQAAKGSH